MGTVMGFRANRNGAAIRPNLRFDRRVSRHEGR